MGKFEGVSYNLSDGTGLCLTKFPDRKNIALCTFSGNTLTPLAFMPEDRAAELKVVLDKIASAKVQENDHATTRDT